MRTSPTGAARSNRLPELIACVRRALLARAVLRELVLWSAVLGTLSLGLALALPGLPRWPLLALVGLAPVVGSFRARRTRPDDADLVMWIDRRLAAGEAVLTAWEVGANGSPWLAPTLAQAEACLSEARPADVRPKIVRGDAWGLAMACATFLAAHLVPSPPPPRAAPGRDTIVVRQLEALRRIERLPEQAARPEQRRHLQEAARRAAELRGALEAGIERRDALDRLEGIREALEAARPSVERRVAQQAAARALADERAMREAVQEQNLEALDRAVERAAARRERADRERASAALRAAADAARGQGDEALAQALLARERLLRRRAEQAALARELLEAMPELADVGRALERLERDGNGAELNRAMVEAMSQAWSRLSAEQRQRLADALRHAPVVPGEQDATAAEGEATRAEAIERALREALEHLDELQVQIGRNGTGLPIARPSAGRGSGPAQGAEPTPDADGRQPGEDRTRGEHEASQQAGGEHGGQHGNEPGPGGGHSEARGSSRPLGAEGDLLARVRPRLGPGAPSGSTIEWIDPTGTPLPEGAYAGRATSGAVDGEPGAIERLAIPDEYREHVRTYFEE